MADIFIGNIKGPQGDTGPQGNQGEKGDAATIRVGSVTTTQYGQTAKVTNSGTEHDAVFDFVIPQGRPGEQTTRIDNLLLDALTEPSASFPVPAVGDNGSTLFGKISKWFSDMAALVATKFPTSNVVNNLTTTASGYALDARQGKALSDLLNTMNIASVTRYTATITTGGTGNIALGGVPNDGLTAVVAPYVNASDVCLRLWVSSAQNAWFLTAINPNTGATVNNTSLQIRYWVIKFKQA